MRIGELNSSLALNANQTLRVNATNTGFEAYDLPYTHTHSGTDISTIDGDRLPAMSSNKRGSVHATGSPTGRFLCDDGAWQAVSGGSTPVWKGNIVGCWGDGNPNNLLSMMLHNPVNATLTNISTSVARCAFFKLDTDITVNKIRFSGIGATTNVYRVAIYRLSDLARLTSELAFTTTAQAWGSVGVGGITLSAGVIYFVAVAVNATGTTAGVQCFSGFTGRIGVLPTLWPGNLQINEATPRIDALGFCQFALTNGALPNPAPALSAQVAWTGGMPALFLDNNNA